MLNSQLDNYQVEAWDTLQHLFKVKNINDHTLHFVAKLSKRLDLERFKKAVNLSADAFPLIRSSFNETKNKSYWEDKAYTVDDMLKILETSNIDENVNEFICKEIDAFKGPQLKIEIIRDDKNDTLCVLINHMLCDAAGFKEYLYMLSHIYSNIDENPYNITSPMANRKISQILKKFSVREKLKIMFSKNDMFSLDQAKFKLEGDLSNPFIEIRTILKEDFCKIKAYAKKNAATVNDVILTAYIRVLFQIFNRVVATTCTMDMRKYLPNRRAEGICNLCTNLTCNIGLEIGTNFEQTLIKVKKAMDKEKSNIASIKSINLLERLFDILPYKMAKDIIEKRFANPLIAFTNIGIIDKTRLAFGEVEIAEAYMTGSIKYSPYFQLAISTFDDQPTLSVNLYGSQYDRNIISLFLDKLVQELNDIM
ncbi:WS/DGAT domain-containing protein [Clostridium sp. C2-6-12]|uniref:WS/DGAT domain-containing protein n=1 Tax=Clostridium sp. C2-6-12 TaxID=2698832 RepID=UPI00136EEBC6|nr:WS/DGAT domain-containing protein [Clostridium sp. C2-6-12]